MQRQLYEALSISQKFSLQFMLCHTSTLCLAGADTSVTQMEMAYVGGSVTINCSYQIEDKDKVKYFCREDKNLNCMNVISTKSSNYTQLGRFSMTHHEGREVYTVVISKLTQDDAGRYQCALKPSSHTVVCLTKIHLHVLSEY